ncbi:MAG: hypothetical protein ACLGHL_05865 [Actinomycetota bacterium]
MFGSRNRVVTTTDAPVARGGVSGGPVITGVLVALGAMFLLSAIVAGVLSSLGYLDDVVDGATVELGIGAGIALIVAQFLAYMWGGYTAGRMSRGAGAANGLLVPLMAIVIALLVGAVAAFLGAETQMNLPFTTSRLPIENDLLVEWGPAVGIASLVAMFLGGLIGGIAGARWHTKLERAALEEEREARIEHDRSAAPGATDHGADTAIRTEDGRPVSVGGDRPVEDRTVTSRGDTVDLRNHESTQRRV